MTAIKIISLVCLLSFPFMTFGQFNTVKKIKVLPLVLVDSHKQVNTPKAEDSVGLINSTGFKVRAEPSHSIVSMPLSRLIINSNFGNRIDPLTGKEVFHQGVDFKSSSDSVMVIMQGEVKNVAYSPGLGNYIEVEHGNFRTTYGHLSFVMVREKMKVDAGSVIGITGSTGRSTGDHLHFSIKTNGRTIDPIPFLDIIYQTLELNARKRTVGASRN